MKQIRKYRDFYNNIKYRTNVFEWYPFKEDAKLLYVGDSAILESYFYNALNVVRLPCLI